HFHGEDFIDECLLFDNSVVNLVRDVLLKKVRLVAQMGLRSATICCLVGRCLAILENGSRSKL
ncbi:hypothetical protein HN51_012864, partial [Arachis hypogaea]